MYDTQTFLVVLATARSTRCSRANVAALRKQLHKEWMRYEHARLVRIRHLLNVACLRRPDVAPWMYIWYFGTGENVMHISSLSRGSFNQLGDRLTLFYKLRIYKPAGGRPRRIQLHHQVLDKRLCTKFGVPHTTLNCVVNDAEKAMHQDLSTFGPARFMWLTIAREKELAHQTGARALMFQLVWGFIDGKNYRVQQPPQRDLQNAHCNGWLHGVLVMRTLRFSCDGLIVWTKHNSRYEAIPDSAFPCSGRLIGRIMTPMKEGERRGLVSTIREVAVKKARQISFVRQAVEWDRGSIEKMFHRLLHPLPACKSKRKLRLDNFFRVAIYRLRSVEVSQIRATCLPRRQANF
ncbi:hypothetical protein PHMEG_00020220 [Phytophthora megakarya]|uniref:Uncharacterized protein n=1 Tax=Phytophthora megakarya TaxID=4795 RepID=A0A225VPZ0_9STRA|nr:hypothetical protein PHMEG_00020220 [Phytophthora megakarya]